MAITELAFHPTEHSFTVSGALAANTQFYVQYSLKNDFSSYGGSPKHGVNATTNIVFTHHVPVDPRIANAGDLVYWRLAKWDSTYQSFTNYGATNKIRLRRPRSDQFGWKFVVGPSMNSGSADISTASKQFGIPFVASAGADFLVSPGNLGTITAAGQWDIIRHSLTASGLNIPIYMTPGRNDGESDVTNRSERLFNFPCSNLRTNGHQIIRSPDEDPQIYERSTAVGSQGSYYAFSWGNSLFIMLNDYHNGTFNINTQQKNWFASVLAEQRHKYRWCFTFSSTPVDAVYSGGTNTIANNSSLRSWLMNLQSVYNVTAHFSSDFKGWRCSKTNNIWYVTSNLGGTAVDTSNANWYGNTAVAIVKIGTNGDASGSIDYCKIDITHTGYVDGSGYDVGQILNTSTDNNGICQSSTEFTDKSGDEQPLCEATVRKIIVPMSSSGWLYSDKSNPVSSASLVDHILSEDFTSPNYQPIMYHGDLSDADLLMSWKVGSAPFYAGIVSDSFTDNYAASDVTDPGSPVALNYRLYNELRGTALSTYTTYISSPCYFVKTFDVGDEISVSEIQIIYEFLDAAYVWINGILAWQNDGEGLSTGTGPPFSVSNRPVLDPDFVDRDGESFVSSLYTLSPDAPSGDSVTSPNDSHYRSPSVHYETSAQPIRITDADVISSLKNSTNIVSILLLAGQSGGTSPMLNIRGAMDVEIVVLGTSKTHLYSPQIRSPQEGDMFNRGIITIEWDAANPPSADTSIDSESVTYEIEYTDDYNGPETNWYTLKRRIPYPTNSYRWNVGQMIKSNNVRIRMRARSSTDEYYSNWSISNIFSVNVFDLISPAIVNPIPGLLYTDFILIILDESLIKNTYHQKVRYTIEYSSEKRSIDWTVIAKDITVGQNVIRWNIEDVANSDDYIIRVTSKNVSTCTQPSTGEPDQIARSFIHGIKIQQSGVFLIDTKPPQAVLEIEGNSQVTNQSNQIINIFAEDQTTSVEQIQLRECDAQSELALGDLATTTSSDTCSTIQSLLGASGGLDKFGKKIGNNPKIQWQFGISSTSGPSGATGPISGLRKLEALLTDSGGNTSVQEISKVFVSAFNGSSTLTDFIIIVEQRDKVVIQGPSGSSGPCPSGPPAITVTPSFFEVVYVSTTLGEIYILEPFSRLIYSLDGHTPINKLFNFNGLILIFAYSEITDIGYVYRHDITEPTLLHTFSDSLSKTTGVAEFNDNIYIGLENGKLWRYNGSTFTMMSIPTSDPINTLYADETYLYIGFNNSTNLVLYNGTQFTIIDMDE